MLSEQLDPVDHVDPLDLLDHLVHLVLMDQPDHLDLLDLEDHKDLVVHLETQELLEDLVPSVCIVFRIQKSNCQSENSFLLPLLRSTDITNDKLGHKQE